MENTTKRAEEEARIDIRILAAKGKWCLKRYRETGDAAWLDRLETCIQRHDCLWKELENSLPLSDIGGYLQLESVG